MVLAPLLLAALAGSSTQEIVQPQLAAHLALQPREVRVLVFMKQRYGLKRLRQETRMLHRRDRARGVRGRLEPFCLASQAELAATVDRLIQEGRARDTETLWIVNACSLTVSPDAVDELAQVAGVHRIVWDAPTPPWEVEDSVRAAHPVPGPLPGRPPSGATPNVTALQAPELWSIGITGAPVLILNIDGGVADDHPDLASSIWSNPGEIAGNGIDDDGNGFVDDTWGWDFLGGDNDPYGGGHGTNTAGIVLGDGTLNAGIATGMAPDATMAVARVSGEADMLAAYQYAVTIGADCVTSSQSLKWPFVPDYHALRTAVEVELLAGIVHTNSIGNQGQSTSSNPIPWNVSSPGNCPGPWPHPEDGGNLDRGRTAVLAVGAILLDSDDLDPISSIGPSAWEDVSASDPTYPHPQDATYWDYPYLFASQPGLMKPDLVAYTQVLTTDGNSDYETAFAGTSAAAPHVGGAVCLLLDANPTALPRQISQALQETAIDLDAPGKDKRTGAGKVQAYDAALRILGLATAYPLDPRPGETVRFDVTGPPGTPFIVGLSFTPGTTPTGLGFELEAGLPIFEVFSGIHAGYDTPATFEINVPQNPAFSGVTGYLQMVTDDTQGATRTWLLSLLETVSVQ